MSRVYDPSGTRRFWDAWTGTDWFAVGHIQHRLGALLAADAGERVVSLAVQAEAARRVEGLDGPGARSLFARELWARREASKAGRGKVSASG